MQYTAVEEYKELWSAAPKYPWKQKYSTPAIADTKKKYKEAAISAYQELSPAILSVIITKLVHKIFNVAFLEAPFISAVAFFLTLVVRNLCKEYPFIAKCEEIALEIVRRWPYIQVAAAIIAAATITYFPAIGVPMSVGVGVLVALTYRVRWLSAAAYKHIEGKLA
ncbi:MAG: hypothetical protein JSR46_11755 [Verrucomicrobia bacterium]|nr:hypothetical protein [Verrucomicrobiota bacterium]